MYDWKSRITLSYAFHSLNLTYWDPSPNTLPLPLPPSFTPPLSHPPTLLLLFPSSYPPPPPPLLLFLSLSLISPPTPLPLHPQPSVSSYRKIFIFVSADKSRNSGLATVGIFICDKSTGDDYVPDKNKNKRYFASIIMIFEQYYYTKILWTYQFFLFTSMSIAKFLLVLYHFFSSHSVHNKNPYSDDPALATVAPTPLSGRSYVWLCTGNSSGLDSRPPMQRIYRK